MTRKVLLIFTVLAVGFGTLNLSVPIAQEANPCLDADIRRAEAEVRAQTQATLIEAQKYHADELQKENRKLNRRLDFLKTTGRRERQQAVTVYDQVSQEQLADIDKDAQLADALRRIHRANRRKICRILRVGCVPK